MNRRNSTFIGFTLIEMVVAILLLGILGAGVAAFIVRPIEGYRDLARRAALTDAAESALRRLERDIRTALPNSVRVTNLGGGGFAVETLPILDGALYRNRADSGGTATGFNRLNPNANDTDFDIHKFFQHVAVPSSSTTHRLVVDNLGTTGQDNVYTANDNPIAVITPSTTVIAYAAAGLISGGAAAHHVSMNPQHRFRGHSPRRRIYIVETPVTYLCTPNAANPALGTLMRYAGYNISSVQPTDPNAAPLATAASARVADRVSACNFNTSTVDIRNRATATLTLSLEDDGERIRLLHQVQIDNSR